jgi:CelD/BcsL family acetyltransferase involved in cellulose biosynthesis
VGSNPKIIVCTSADDLLRLRSLWEQIYSGGLFTIFQDFELTLLAAERFADREQPYVICAESPNGAAIVPAALRSSDNSIRLLGEELFDYRCCLHCGDEGVLRTALAELGRVNRSLEIVAMRELDCNAVTEELQLTPFAPAPCVRLVDISAEQLTAAHHRLARNLRRMERLDYELRKHNGTNSELLRLIYAGKAAQLASSLFHDSARIEFLVAAGQSMPDTFEIFALEKSGQVAAAVVTLLDRGCRRFYTGWFSPELEKHSPALSLIYEITRQSLAAGLDCDYMTGEQPYKMRLATNSVQLYKMKATPKQLAAVDEAYKLKAVG